jgi:protein TonB
MIRTTMIGTPMFSALESAWDHSARRRWTTLASFTMQALGLSLLIAISFIWVERPPLVHWLQFTAPATFAPHVETQQTQRGHGATGAVAGPRLEPIVTPSSVPRNISTASDPGSGVVAPDLVNTGYGPGGGTGDGVPYGLGDMHIVIPTRLARPAPIKPLVVSHLEEANLIYRVQPTYPTLARTARIQGTVELRAIVSKAGTIENLAVVSGHPMLVSSAIEAVRQWRYRPYLLNNEPIEVATEITVNFVLSGS